MSKETNINFRCTRQLKEELEGMADLEDRSLSDFINRTLTKTVQEEKDKGNTPKD